MQVGDENEEVPVVEMVPPVGPSVAMLRAGFVGLDEWNLEEVFSHACGPEILVGVFPRCTEIGIGGDFVRCRTENRVILAYMCVKFLVRLYVCRRVGLFWVYFGSILGPFWVHFGSILGPFWVHFGSIKNRYLHKNQ